MFQPTPRFVSEANYVASVASTTAILFQPTPRFVSEANGAGRRTRSDLGVSTHAPLRQRGELAIRWMMIRFWPFQPTPRFVSEANAAVPGSGLGPGGFNPRPASSARRTWRNSLTGSDSRVSTHAPLRQRGEPFDRVVFLDIVEFQPTPRFVSEANSVVSSRPVLSQVFQPTPRFVSEANPICAE